MNCNVSMKVNGNRDIGIVKKVNRDTAVVCLSCELENHLPFWLPVETQRRFLTLPRTPCGSPNYIIASYVRAEKLPRRSHNPLGTSGFLRSSALVFFLPGRVVCLARRLV